jgi:hypothetical protein
VIISVEDATFTGTERGMTSSKQCQINVVFLFGTEGIVCKEFVPSRHIVNGNFY